MNIIIYFLLPAIIFACIFFAAYVLIYFDEPIFSNNRYVGLKGISGTSIDDIDGGIVFINDIAILAKTYSGTIERNWPVLVVEYCKKEKIYKVERFA